MFENAHQLLGIPKLPDELFILIRKPEPEAEVEQVEQSYDKNTVMQLRECLTIAQLDDLVLGSNWQWSLSAFGHHWSYGTNVDKQSHNYKHKDCSTLWYKFKANTYYICWW